MYSTSRSARGKGYVGDNVFDLLCVSCRVRLPTHARTIEAGRQAGSHPGRFSSSIYAQGIGNLLMGPMGAYRSTKVALRTTAVDQAVRMYIRMYSAYVTPQRKHESGTEDVVVLYLTQCTELDTCMMPP